MRDDPRAPENAINHVHNCHLCTTARYYRLRTLEEMRIYHAECEAKAREPQPSIVSDSWFLRELKQRGNAKK